MPTGLGGHPPPKNIVEKQTVLVISFLGEEGMLQKTSGLHRFAHKKVLGDPEFSPSAHGDMIMKKCTMKNDYGISKCSTLSII